MTDILGKSPDEYYNFEQAEKYELSGAFKRIQARMTQDALKIVKWEKGSKVLDLGCGTGFSTIVHKNAGFKVIGCDINPNMLRFAANKGLKIIECDMKNLPFSDERFDYLISISTIQWADPKDYSKILEEICRVISKEAIIQFYPKSEAEFDYFYEKCRKLFKANVVLAGEGNKGKKYVTLKKRK